MKLSHTYFDKPFKYQLNKNFSIGTIRYLEAKDFDFNVFLKTKNCNLQRDLVWTDLQKEQLIISILKEIAIPKCCLIQKDDIFSSKKYKYLVIDGKQRLTTLFAFYNNEFYITIDHKKYYYEDLDSRLQARINNFHVIADVAYSYEENSEFISDDEIIEWFERVNFAGTYMDIQHLKDIKNSKIEE
jgi:uncharacterized protein with ParB-like and HNH nuclease domain